MRICCHSGSSGALVPQGRGDLSSGGRGEGLSLTCRRCRDPGCCGPQALGQVVGLSAWSPGGAWMASWLRKGTGEQEGGAAKYSYRYRAGARQSRAQMEATPKRGHKHGKRRGQDQTQGVGTAGEATSIRAPYEPAAELHVQNHPHPVSGGPQGCCPGRNLCEDHGSRSHDRCARSVGSQQMHCACESQKYHSA